MFNNYSIIWIIRIFLQIRIWIRIFLPESRIFGFGFENFLTTNKIRIRKFSGSRIRFEIRICSKKRFVSTLIYTIWSIVCEASCHPVIWLSIHPVIPSSGHPDFPSSCHPVIQSTVILLSHHHVISTCPRTN